MVDFGPERTWLDEQVCGYNARPERSPVGDCGAMPVLHLRLLDGYGFLAACVEHREFALRMPHLDHHEWGTWCDFPGARWHPSPTSDEAGSFCAIDDSGVEPVLAGREAVAASA